MISDRDPPPLSPCIGVCKLNAATGLCEGCYRTVDEIAAWPNCSVEQKRIILARLEQRCARLLEAAFTI